MARKTKQELMTEKLGNFGAPTRYEVGRRLQALREAAGYSTRVEIAAELGMPRTTYANYEFGCCSLSYETIWDICSLLKITPNDLLGFEGASEETLVHHEKLNALATADPADVVERALLPNATEFDSLLAIDLLAASMLQRQAGRR